MTSCYYPREVEKYVLQSFATAKKNGTVWQTRRKFLATKRCKCSWLVSFLKAFVGWDFSQGKILRTSLLQKNHFEKHYRQQHASSWGIKASHRWKKRKTEFAAVDIISFDGMLEVNGFLLRLLEVFTSSRAKVEQNGDIEWKDAWLHNIENRQKLVFSLGSLKYANWQNLNPFCQIYGKCTTKDAHWQSATI